MTRTQDSSNQQDDWPARPAERTRAAEPAGRAAQQHEQRSQAARQPEHGEQSVEQRRHQWPADRRQRQQHRHRHDAEPRRRLRRPELERPNPVERRQRRHADQRPGPGVGRSRAAVVGAAARGGEGFIGSQGSGSDDYLQEVAIRRLSLATGDRRLRLREAGPRRARRRR